MAQIFRKTAKGQREIETREHRLTPRFRSALIIVDGRRDVTELATLLPQDGLGTLQQLLTDGFIESIGTSAPAPAPGPAPAPATTAAAPAAPAASPVAAPAAAASSDAPKRELAALQREAVRTLTEAVGPMGEALALRIERCKSYDELKPLLATAMQVIGNTRGAAAARAYGERFGVGDSAG